MSGSEAVTVKTNYLPRNRAFSQIIHFFLLVNNYSLLTLLLHTQMSEEEQPEEEFTTPSLDNDGSQDVFALNTRR